MPDDRAYSNRPESEAEPEQEYLQMRIMEIEKDLGQLAARGRAAPISQPLDALDRARELATQMHKQVRVRPLDDAIRSRLAWLDRVAQRQAADDDEPRTALDQVDLDRRILEDLLAGWRREHS